MITTRRIATALALAGAAFILYIGIGYLTVPQSIAPSFGLPAWPSGDAEAFMNLKGVRDVASGILFLALLATGQRFATGIAMLAMSVVPLGDMLTILRWDGSTTTAITVHGFTAALVFLAGVLFVREGRTPATATAPTRVATHA
ncbi:DUF4267 domain-containing protein [Nocardia huaxiensis]|uniref:DUF4267 domain-containing protein n=1 Tax=Nocardia huaxiensis TaxID=2755382 RepID=UPI001E2F521B|nr:DUF4267 domain-containing protein [Nocardia huaxiensis]UFS93342.1 DUF4267 domain-containing protein [Nocardia huaxiensis]